MRHSKPRFPGIRLALAAILLAAAGGGQASAAPREPSAPADRAGPPGTHFALTAAPPEHPLWLLAAPYPRKEAKKGTRLFALTARGDFHILRLGGGEGAAPRLLVERYPIPSDISAGVLPAILPGGRFAGAGQNATFIVLNPVTREWRFVYPSLPPSTLSRPVALDAGTVAAVGADGSLLLFREGGEQWKETHRVPVGSARALTDALLAAADLDGDGRKELIVPAAPSGRYGHGVLGDAVKPTEVRAYKVEGDRLRLLSRYPAGGGGVFESLGALAADLDGDGREEILITRSDADGGAAHLVLGLRAGRLALKARGKAVGQGNRWSHLLGAFDVDGSGPKVLAIETPHLAGFLLALRMYRGELRERARRGGFTTHAIGSRNLWEFALLRRAGVPELAVQEVGRRRLAGLALFGSRWVLRWTYPLPAPVGSNLLAADVNGDSHEDLAFADRDGTVHLLLSRPPAPRGTSAAPAR